jgi:thioredoxin reductase
MANLADALIVGAGPAGLTAALTLARQQQSSILFDEGTYRNDTAEYIHLIPGFDHLTPFEYRDAAKSNILSNYPQHITLQKVRVSNVQKDASTGTFNITDEAGKTWNGKKLILAIGVEDIPLSIDGYDKCWGKGMYVKSTILIFVDCLTLTNRVRFHCLFCKGYEERGCPSAGVLAIGGLSKVPLALHVARQVCTLTDSVTIYTNGSEDLAKEISAGFKTATVMKVDIRRISRFSKESEKAAVRIEFEDGSSVVESFLAHTPETKPRGSFAGELGLEQTPNSDIKAGPPFYQTSVKGAFAAGDSCGMMKNIPHAIFSGSLAAMGVSMQIVAETLGQTPLFG